MFAQQSMLTIFSDRTDDILSNVDPGEFGLESELCRCGCLFLFILMIIDDLRESISLVTMLYNIPHEGPEIMHWLSYNPPKWTTDKKYAKDMFGASELDYITFKVGGMTRTWKLVNFCIVCLPKILIWLLLATAGTQFLMETGGQTELVVNCLAMTFILDIDELVADRLCTEATKAIMEKLQGWDQFDVAHLEEQHDQEVVTEFRKNEQEYRLTDSRLMLLLVPRRLLMVITVTTCLYMSYFLRFCTQTDDGSKVSYDVYPPKHGTLMNWNVFQWFVAPDSIAVEDNPSWSWSFFRDNTDSTDVLADSADTTDVISNANESDTTSSANKSE